MFNNLTVVIPVKCKPEHLIPFMKEMGWLFKSAKTIVIDSGGGENLKAYSHVYIKKDVPLWEARRLGYDAADTKFILNLDSDTILSKKYINEALNLLEKTESIAVAIDYEECQGHYAFGTSLWKTPWLKKLYDWTNHKRVCECLYMWWKIHQVRQRLETLPYRAKHLKSCSSTVEVL
jgi:hypothetical protein